PAISRSRFGATVAAVAVLSLPAGRLCTLPSMITPASPSPACCPISKAKPPSPFYMPPSPFTLSTALPSAACSPTTAPAIAPASSAPPASNSESSTASLVLTLRAPMAKPNASSKPPCASGPTFAITSTPKNAISISPHGSSTTTSTVRMVASVTLRPSAELLRVQRLDRSQPPRDGFWRDSIDHSGYRRCYLSYLGPQCSPSCPDSTDLVLNSYLLDCDLICVETKQELHRAPGQVSNAQICGISGGYFAPAQLLLYVKERKYRL